MDKKILVVSAKKNFMAEIKKNIQELGFEIFEDFNGSKAYSIARKKGIDLIIFDVDLPGVNGFLIVNKLKKKKDTKNIPMIVLSEKTSLEQINNHKTTSMAAEYYVKLPNSSEILSNVKSLLNIVDTFQPDIIHTNHIWILSSLLKKLFPHWLLEVY